MQVLIIIPARGGSKGIPRKNLRPLGGKPLLYYSIKVALSSSFSPDVYVSTDDDEIAYFSRKFGAQIHFRDSTLAGDLVTLDPVIYDAYASISEQHGKKYDYVVTLQPTSPLITVQSLDGAINKMIQSPSIETILSAVNDTHLTWGKNGKTYIPNYQARVNRQLLPPIYKETGGFFISRADIMTAESRIGRAVELYEVKQHEAIDIDSFEDWNLCEYYLKRKTILFCVSGYQEIGMGHVYNCLILASQIMDHRVIFLVDSKSDLAYTKISESNYEVHKQQALDLVEDIVKLSPDVVVNDRLDTSIDYVLALKKHGMLVVNIEDLGEGATHADLVINAIYPEKEALPKHYFGPEFFCARDEFLFQEEKQIKPVVETVLLSFGGVDPANLTLKVLTAVYDYCVVNKISIEVILGLGYKNEIDLHKFEHVHIERNVKSISEHMHRADIAFSSAGRTIYELALSGTPSIVMAQNERELTHFFASSENGFLPLGLGESTTEESILSAFVELCTDYTRRKKMHQQMKNSDIRNGRNKVITLIRQLLG